MPLSLPLVGAAATVMVCPVPVVAAMVAPCLDPPAGPDMVIGILVSVFGPEVATITGALGVTGALVDATGRVDAIGAMLTGIVIP